MLPERTSKPNWFTDFVDTIEANDAEYLRCEGCGAGELPPRDTCPECGSTDLVRKPLPEEGRVVTYTEIQSTIEKFEGETPYTVVVVELTEDLRLTGQLRNADSVAIDDAVAVAVERRDERADIVTFEPV